MNCLLKRLAAAAIAAWCLGATADAAPPKITRLSIRGFQIGGTTRLSVQGTDLGTAPQLLLGAPLKEQKLVGEAKPTSAEFEVSVDPSAAAGIYRLRIATAEGVSAPEFVEVNALPQRLIAPAGGTVAKLVPVAMHGTLTGSAVQELTFSGKRGESVTIDVLARRFGSKLRPVVHLYDVTRRQLAWSLPQPAIGGDTRLTATLPADGEYVVAVHDLTYAAASPGCYRIAIGAFDYVDQVFPPVVERGSSTVPTLIGRIGKRPTTELAPSDVAAAADDGDYRPLPWPLRSTPLGPQPGVALSDLCELVEDGTLEAARKLPFPSVAVSGRLLKPGEVDHYHLDLAADEAVCVEVFADRYGSPIDAVVELLSDKQAQIVVIDDTVGPDPRFDYAGSKKPTTITIAVRDALRRGGEDCVYRLVVTKVEAAAPQRDFRLTLFEDTLNVAADGTKVFRVLAERSGYDGAIRLSVDGLPKGFAASEVEIPAGADGALVEVRQTGAGDGVKFGQIAIRGEAVDLKSAIVRKAQSAVTPLGAVQPWMSGELLIAASQTSAPAAVAWNAESATGDALFQGTDEKLGVRIDRQPDQKGTVRLSLLTTQAAPAGNPQQAAAQMLRGVAATVDVKPDPKKDTADFAVRVPADVRQAAYDIAIRAELLGADGKTVVAEAFTPPRRFQVRPPIEIVAVPVSSDPITLDAKNGAAIALTGTLKRLNNYSGDVTITLVGLPAGVVAPTTTLKPKKDDFKLEFKLPPTFAAGKLDGVKISAMITPDNRRANTAGKAELTVPALDVRKPSVASKTDKK